MRRKDREITDCKKIDEIMSRCHCCRLGFYDNDEIYIVPLNFGYQRHEEQTVLYFHGAKEGRKITLISSAKTVGFEMDTDYKLNEGQTACSYSASFQSIIGNGKISFVDEISEKSSALQCIMYHNTQKDDWDFSDAMLNSVCIFKIVVTSMTCKTHE